MLDTYAEIPRNGTIVEVTERLLNDALNVMPPIYVRGCFALGEPLSHNIYGEGVFYHFAQMADDRCYGMIGTNNEAGHAFKDFHGLPAQDTTTAVKRLKRHGQN